MKLENYELRTENDLLERYSMYNLYNICNPYWILLALKCFKMFAK